MKKSRQSRWQEARKKAGLCTQCGGGPLSPTSDWRCEDCLQYLRDYASRARKARAA